MIRRMTIIFVRTYPFHIRDDKLLSFFLLPRARPACVGSDESLVPNPVTEIVSFVFTRTGAANLSLPYSPLYVPLHKVHGGNFCAPGQFVPAGLRLNRISCSEARSKYTTLRCNFFFYFAHVKRRKKTRRHSAVGIENSRL